MRTKIWIDIETTGLDEKEDEIHQISVKCGKKELNYYLRFKTQPKHELPIPFNVRRVIMEDALIEIHEFIEEISNRVDPVKDGKKLGLTFAGKNPLFDWKFLMEQKLFQSTWKKFFHYNLFDLTAVIYFLKDLGLMPGEQPTKLEELVKYFKLKIEGNPHDSLFDVRATYMIYDKTLLLIKEKNPPTKEREKFIELLSSWYPDFSKKEIINAINSGVPLSILRRSSNKITETPVLEVQEQADIHQGKGLKKQTKQTTVKKPIKKKKKPTPPRKKKPGV